MVKHYQDDLSPPSFIKALAEVRQLATQQFRKSPWQSITTLRKAFGHPAYFLNEPYSIGGKRSANDAT